MGEIREGGFTREYQDAASIKVSKMSFNEDELLEE